MELSFEAKKRILADLIKAFGTLKNAADADATYILIDGTILNTCGPADKNSQHINIARYIKNTYNIGENAEQDGSAFMNEINAIRVTPWINGIVLPKKKITEEQEMALLDLFARLKVSREDPLTITSLDGTQTLICDSLTPFTTYDVIDEIYEYYKRRRFSKVLIEAAKTDIKFIRLTEDTRTTLINNSRNKGDYKDRSHGKNRFERKKYSKIANSVKAYNNIDMNKLFKQDELIVELPIIGETSDYKVTIKLDGVIAELAKNIKNNKNILEYKLIIQAVTKQFNTGNVFIKCTCPDYKYTFAHWNIQKNVSTDDSSKDPGPGKGIRNPKDEKGRGCKHVMLILSNGDWIMKVASVINNYIHYAEEKLQKPFLKLIFPKLYGIKAEEMVEKDLIDDDKYLDSSKGLIDAINEYGRNRGKYQKGSNKNPVTGTGGKPKKEEPKEEDDKK